MKKMLCSVVLLLSVAAFVFAQADISLPAENTDTAIAEPAASEATATTDEPIAFNSEAVVTPKETKLALPIILNILPAFGVGSFVQHDKLGGWIQVGVDVVAVGCAAVTVVYVVSGSLAAAMGGMAGAIFSGGDDASTKEAANEAGGSIFNAANWFLISTVSLGVFSVAWGIVRPIMFRKAYIKSHDMASGRNAPTFAVLPVIEPGKYGAVALFRY